MRCYCLVLLSLLLSGSLTGQPTYDRSFFWDVGSENTQIVMENSFAESFSQGAAQSWSYPINSPIIDTTQTNFIKASDAPGADNFPEATLASTGATAFMGQTSSNAVFYKIANDQVVNLGTFTSIGEGSSFAIEFENPRVVQQFPMQFNESFTDTFKGSGQFQQNGFTLNFEISGNDKVVYDAYGTLKNSERTFENVVRLKRNSYNTTIISAMFRNIATNITDQTTFTYKQPGRPEPLIQFFESTVTSVDQNGDTTKNENTGLTVSPRLWDKTVGINDQGSLKGIALMPNPASNNLRVFFGLKQARSIKVQLVNMKGHIVKSRDLGTVNAGNHQHHFQVSDLPSGTYQLVFQTPDARETRSVILR